MYLFEVVVVRSHFVLTLLLVLAGLPCDLLFIMINFIGRKNIIGIIGSQFEVMSFQLMQFLIIQLRFLNIVPSFVQHLIGGRK